MLLSLVASAGGARAAGPDFDSAMRMFQLAVDGELGALQTQTDALVRDLPAARTSHSRSAAALEALAARARLHDQFAVCSAGDLLAGGEVTETGLQALSPASAGLLTELAATQRGGAQGWSALPAGLALVCVRETNNVYVVAARPLDAAWLSALGRRAGRDFTLRRTDTPASQTPSVPAQSLEVAGEPASLRQSAGAPSELEVPLRSLSGGTAAYLVITDSSPLQGGAPAAAIPAAGQAAPAYFGWLVAVILLGAVLLILTGLLGRLYGRLERAGHAEQPVQLLAVQAAQPGVAQPSQPPAESGAQFTAALQALREEILTLRLQELAAAPATAAAPAVAAAAPLPLAEAGLPGAALDLLEASPEPMLLIDTGEIIAANEAAASLTGRSVERLRGASASAVLGGLPEVAPGAEPLKVELLLKPGGMELPAQAHIHCARIGGRPLQVVVLRLPAAERESENGTTSGA